jgi:DNA-binding transcriptional LysR family regulator
MIDRTLLRYFLAVVDRGNFSRAAAHCRVSQPTLSIGVARLERTLGEPLFIRNSRRVELTAAGVRLSAQARRIEAAFVEAETAAPAETPRKLIRLGLLSTLPSRWIETALVAVRAAAPLERLEIVEGRQSDVLGLLGRGRVDAAVGVIDGDPRAREVLFTEDYGLAMARSHPLAARTGINAEEVAAEPMIVRRHCEALGDTSRYFTARGVRPFMAARTTHDDRALAYVRSGLGVTVMPRGFAGEDIAMASLTGSGLTRRVGLLIEPDSAARVEGADTLRLFGDSLKASAAG